MFSLLDVGNGSGRHAISLGEVPTYSALTKKISDLSNVIARKFDVLWHGAGGSELIKCGVPINPQSVSESEPAEDRANRSEREIHLLGDIFALGATHPTHENMVYHLVGNDAVLGDAWKRLGSFFAKLFQRGVPANTKSMTPRSSRVDILDGRIRNTGLLGYFSYGKSIHSHLVDRVDIFVCDGRAGASFSSESALPDDKIIGVFLGGAPAKVFGIAAGWIVARVKGKHRRISGGANAQEERNSVGSGIVSAGPKHSVSTGADGSKPWPTYVFIPSLNILPEAHDCGRIKVKFFNDGVTHG